jgi:hypothetical protein
LILSLFEIASAPSSPKVEIENDTLSLELFAEVADFKDLSSLK